MLIQFGLTKQHDLDQLFMTGFKIGQQPNLFQGFHRHGMRFVDQRHDPLAVTINLN